MRWLETLVWPEQDARRERLQAAIQIVRADPPHLFAGDLNETVAMVASDAPPDATLVIFHSAVLAYLDAGQRGTFISTVQDLPGYWISNEGSSVVPRADLPPSPDPAKALFVIAQDGEPVAYASSHGQSLYGIG